MLVDKAKLDGKVNELNTANTTINQLQDAVKKFDGADLQKLKNDVTNWETKYNADVSKLNTIHSARKIFSGTVYLTV
ncbi:MAG TPA: hypothetical protein DCY74_06600 [Clostridiales bacterium]|jgi:uncharacterized protein HemX|nr:hypothetical protein [Clostridiales bacterium]HCG35739.1 hypothetical protein [Clostridiales bacterium]